MNQLNRLSMEGYGPPTFGERTSQCQWTTLQDLSTFFYCMQAPVYRVTRYTGRKIKILLHWKLSKLIRDAVVLIVTTIAENLLL